MSEFMANICGIYEAKLDGFLPGGASLHNCMSAHGPDEKAFEGASRTRLCPERVSEGALSFMFESIFALGVTPWAINHPNLQKDYWKAWSGLKCNFKTSANVTE